MLKILLAKGRIYDSVAALLSDAGISIYLPERTYFPITNQSDLSFQVVKPQIVSTLLAAEKADVGFSGKDWVHENGADRDVEEVIDLGFDPVRIVAAVPDTVDFEAMTGAVTVATEYQNLSHKWLKKRGIAGEVFRTWGTSEGFVREGENSLAQILVDNTSTGSSLRANNLKIVDTLMESSTRMYASKQAMNVARDKLDALVESLPSMKSPTVSPLFGDGGYAIKTAVAKIEVPKLLPRLKALGATDIVEYSLRKVVP